MVSRSKITVFALLLTISNAGQASDDNSSVIDTVVGTGMFITPIISCISTYILEYTKLQAAVYADALIKEFHTTKNDNLKKKCGQKVSVFAENFNIINGSSTTTNNANSTTISSILLMLLSLHTSDRASTPDNTRETLIQVAQGCGVVSIGSSLTALGAAINNHRNFLLAKQKAEKA